MRLTLNQKQSRFTHKWLILIEYEMMFLLDTNVISELRKGKKNQSAKVVAWAGATPAKQCYLSAITVLELEQGVQRLEYETPPQGSALRTWLNGISSSYQGRILPFDERAARICASLHIPNKRPERDAMIASVARSHGLTVVTRNIADFVNTGVALFNPFD
jgi:predicted nucleic acid-binding protein